LDFVSLIAIGSFGLVTFVYSSTPFFLYNTILLCN
jgi:hypothetical protein